MNIKDYKHEIVLISMWIMLTIIIVTDIIVNK